jgi:hypothetical protein
MLWKEGAILDVTNKKNCCTSWRRKSNILSPSAGAFLFSYPYSFFSGISLQLSLYSSLFLPVTGKYGALALMVQKIATIKACRHASKYFL